MWKPSLAIAALVASLAALSSPAIAQDYPFCLRQGDEAGPGHLLLSNLRAMPAQPRQGAMQTVTAIRAWLTVPINRPTRYAPEPGISGNPYPGYGIPGNIYAGGGPYGANQATNRPNASNEIAGGR